MLETSKFTCPIMQVHDLCLLRLQCLLSLLQLATCLPNIVYSYLVKFFYACMLTLYAHMQLQCIILIVMALYTNLQSTVATFCLPSVLPGLLYTATVVCLPSLHYNSLYVAQPLLPFLSVYVCLPIASYLVWSTWLSGLLCLSSSLSVLQTSMPTQ